MGEIADEMIERYLSGDWDDSWYDEPSYPEAPTPGIARPEMLIVSPTDFKDYSK